MSGVVGSMPSLTRSGLPCARASSSFLGSAAAGRESTASRDKNEASPTALGALLGTGPNARLSPFRTGGNVEAGRRSAPTARIQERVWQGTPTCCWPEMPDDQRPNKRPRRPKRSRPTLVAASHDVPSLVLLEGRPGQTGSPV